MPPSGGVSLLRWRPSTERRGQNVPGAGTADPPESENQGELPGAKVAPWPTQMSALGHLAIIARQLGPAELARAVARRASAGVRRAVLRPRACRAADLASSLGLEEGAAAERLLDDSGSAAWCDVAQRERVLSVLERFPKMRRRALFRAERAARGELLIFGARCFLAQARGGRAERWFDPKLPWAIGRLDQLLALGQGYWAAEEPGPRARFARALTSQLRDFLLENPTGEGIQWDSPMEVALRAANIAQALKMVRDSPLVRAPDFALEVLAALESHLGYVEANLEDGGAVPNNHLVANQVGLLISGLLFPLLPGSHRRIARSVRSLRELIQAQVHPEGWSFEGAVGYHRLSTELFTLAHLVSRSQGVDLGEAYEERLSRMYRVAEAYCSERGLAPQLGDNDSGRVFPLCDRQSLDHGYLAPLGAALFGEARLKRKGAAFPDEAAWLLGERGWSRFRRLRPGARPESLSTAGLHVFRGGGATLAISAGKNGQRGVGGHSHNDQLSFELHWQGFPVIVDPGSPSYRAPLRDCFRGTAAHNTIEVPGEEQSPIDSSRPFALPDSARCEVLELEQGAEVKRLVARHLGYARLRPPLVVERELVLDKRGGVLSVADRLVGEGARDLLSRLHLPDEEVRLRAPAKEEVERASKARLAPVRLGPLAAELGPPDSPRGVVLVDSRGRVSLERSAYSRGYGELAPALCLLISLHLELPAQVGFLVLLGPGTS